MQQLPFKAVVSDLDGTLLNTNHVIGEFTIDILNKFAEAVDFLTGKLGLFGTVGAGLGIGAFIQNLDWLKCRAAKIA